MATLYLKNEIIMLNILKMKIINNLKILNIVQNKNFYLNIIMILFTFQYSIYSFFI